MNLHQRAVELVRKYHRVEAELVDVLGTIDDRKAYREHGATSLFVYATKVLGLSESVAWNLITVLRATKKSPVLKYAIEAGELSVSKARRITAVLTLENQNEWVEKAKTLSRRELERELTREKPHLVKLEIEVRAEELEEIKYVQDLVCQSKQAGASLSETVLEAVRFYRRHKDPIERAKRARASVPGQVERQAVRGLPAAVEHALAKRDENRCVGTNPDGSRCESRRWLDFHHVVPKNQGGANTLENMVTLCRAHHLLHHHEPDRTDLI